MRTTSVGLPIGQLAKLARVGVETVRFYERQGLLPEPPREGAGAYRRYPPESLSRLRFIGRAKALGFSLSEIETLLSLHPDSAASCAEVSERIRQKIAETDAKIRDLKAMRRGLSTLSSACGKRPFLARCPLLDALGAAGEPTGSEAEPT
jgi:MerR family transcriptional regulator, copper efflux regulator